MPASAILLALALANVESPSAPEHVASVQQSLPSGIGVTRGAMRLRVEALTSSVLRVRIAPAGVDFEDASWAVPSAVRKQSARVSETANGFRTDQLQVEVDLKSLAITVRDAGGKLFHSDHFEPFRTDGSGFTLRKAMPQGERYFGLGDKTGPFDRRGASYVNWNTDAWGYAGATDPLYKSIPFVVAVKPDGSAHGLFLDNPRRSWFDFGHREQGVLAIGADGGAIDYYVIAGPTIADVVRQYTDLTGKAPLAPRWALGFHQSRYSYMTDAQVREVAARLRKDRIPADVLWLDIDYQDRNRPFTTNPKTFPDLKGLAGDLRRDGFKLVAITDLHIARAPGESYAPFDSGTAGDHFLKNPDGSTYVAPVWPGPSVFPDFTRSATRRWWGDLYKPFVDGGVAGFWNDMNEPAIFETPTKTMPLGTLHRIETDDFTKRTATHVEVHNIYGMENSRATIEGLQRLRPNARPFVLTRASYAGGQRYAATWTGDNNSTWEHLKLMVQQLVNLGLSGFSYAGADIGGFTGGASPELMTRWYQLGAFTPVFRSHSAKDTPRGEPWTDGPGHLAIRRRFIEERYRLMPYLYGVAEQNARTGDPIMRPVFYDYPDALAASCDMSIAFTLGRDLLVAASPKPESPQPYDICLPKGGWFDYWSGRRVEGERVVERPLLERMPVFVRAGAIVPRQPMVQSLAQAPRGALSLDIYPGPDCRGEIYWDDGETLGYRRAGYLRQQVICTVDKNGLRVSFGKRHGTFKPWWRDLVVTVHDWTGPARVRAGSGVIAAETDGSARSLRFTLPDQPRGGEISISHS